MVRQIFQMIDDRSYQTKEQLLSSQAAHPTHVPWSNITRSLEIHFVQVHWFDEDKALIRSHFVFITSCNWLQFLIANSIGTVGNQRHQLLVKSCICFTGIPCKEQSSVCGFAEQHAMYHGRYVLPH